MRTAAAGAVAALLAIATVAGACVAACGSSGAESTFDAGADAAADALACAAPASSCGGACVDVATDPKNCGQCGIACAADEQCCAGSCAAAASCAFAVTRVTPSTGNQNGGDWVTIEGSGFAPGMQVLIGDGVAPTRVTSATSAIVQTPPAPIGTYDVAIVSGAQRATKRGGFYYGSHGMRLPWQEKPMAVVRGELPALAVMQDGRVLIAGGTTVPDDDTNALDTAEIYTRSSDQVTPAANKMSVARWRDAAVTLLTGKVLVVGGRGAGSPLADLFDPATSTFAPTAHPMSTPRAFTRAVLMADGRAMIASEAQQTAEIYDPATDAFTPIPTLATHTYGFLVRLRDGRVMLGGGDGGVTDVELYDPAQGRFVKGASLKQGRSMLTAHTLPDGRVIVLGGASLSAGGIHAPLSEIELYDPKLDQWAVAPYTLGVARAWHASALVADGTIIVAGGYTEDGACASLTATVDRVDPVAGKVTPFGQLPHANTEWNAVTLLDGSIVGVGGGACGTATALPDIDFLPGDIVK